ncbi:MAG TPA: phosphoribosylanthranilate isomerase [Candidatus Lokiarchaeia archaeon]|nr:phosphoribosylanthranilate isomerase [Candidatus Lokiarchaeia archaeon]
MVEIKICGIKNDATARVAIECGASYAGIVIGTPDSPRNVTSYKAANLLHVMHDEIKTVLVIKELTRELVTIVINLGPDYVQIHKAAAQEYIDRLHEHLAGGIIFGITPSISDVALGELARVTKNQDLFLVDGSMGNDKAIDHNALLALTDRVKEHLHLRLSDLLVAGGFNHENVATFLRRFVPRGIDASSGLESAPGVKDPALIKAFCAAIKAACPDDY